ncbi:MAG: hypothetical protein IPL33_21070 [Sphingobacteriales bacterium]|nr:hypothetical protein [Sphingobacteriales bacterium]
MGEYVYESTVSGGGLCPDDIALITISVTDCALCPNPSTANFAYLDNTYCLGEVLTATVSLDAGATAGAWCCSCGLGDRCSYGRDELSLQVRRAFMR